MTLTREDMLRELELLPAWKLNQPVSPAPQVDAQAPVVQEAEAPVAQESVQNTVPDIANMDWAALNQYVTGSGDQNADWLLVTDTAIEGDAAILLDKMLIAIQLQRGKNVYLTELSEQPYFKRQLALIQPKLIFVFGEKAAQTLLGSNEPLDALRGKVHQFEGVDLIVSYAPSHLLTQTQDKAKAWADLCLARDTLNPLS
jgi:DNA polymerase